MHIFSRCIFYGEIWLGTMVAQLFFFQKTSMRQLFPGRPAPLAKAFVDALI
jgi:hypothetical protein